MDSQQVAQTFQRALTEYETVIAELNKPKRDVVMQASCELIKKSVGDFLNAYLLFNGKKIDKDNLGELYANCIAIDKSFRDIDLDTILCLGEEGKITCQRCLENGWINYCEDVMIQTKELVFKLVNSK